MTNGEKRVYDLLLRHVGDDVQPSIGELAAQLEIARSGVHRFLNKLLAQGRVEKLGGGERCWKAIPKDPLRHVSSLDLKTELQRRGYRVTS